MLTLLSKCFAHVYICGKIVRSKRKRISVNNNRVLLVEGGHIGDMLMDASAIIAISDYFKQNKKEVYLLCAPALWEMLNIIWDTSKINCIKNDKLSLLTLKNIRKIYSKLPKEGFETVVKITGTINLDVLIAGIEGKKKYGVIDISNSIELVTKLKFGYLKSYTAVIQGNINQHQCLWWEQLLHIIGLRDYVSSNIKIPMQQVNGLPEKDYIAISVDSADGNRRWPIQNFVNLITLLLKKYCYDIYIMGKSIPSMDMKCVQKVVEISNGRVKNIIGKTNMKEWIEWIRKSKFLIGSDSGSVHVAAAVGVMAFCITGVWEGHKCMPYDMTNIVDGTIFPVCIYRRDVDVEHLACFACRNRSGKIGRINKKCYSLCKKGISNICLQKVSAEDVVMCVEKMWVI